MNECDFFHFEPVSILLAHPVLHCTTTHRGRGRGQRPRPFLPKSVNMSMEMVGGGKWHWPNKKGEGRALLIPPISETWKRVTETVKQSPCTIH